MIYFRYTQTYTYTTWWLLGDPITINIIINVFVVIIKIKSWKIIKNPHPLLGGCWEIPGEEATLICRTNNAFRCSQGEENNITSSRSYLDFITIHHFDYTICSGPLRPTLSIPFIITQEISKQTLGHTACLPWGSSAADITQTMLMMVYVVTMRLLKM